MSFVLAGALAWVMTPGVHAGQPVRVAVIGGLEMCGVWPRLVSRIERATGVTVETLGVGNKEIVVPECRRGNVDLLLIHGSDASMALTAEGAAAPCGRGP